MKKLDKDDDEKSSSKRHSSSSKSSDSKSSDSKSSDSKGSDSKSEKKVASSDKDKKKLDGFKDPFATPAAAPAAAAQGSKAGGDSNQAEFFVKLGRQKLAASDFGSAAANFNKAREYDSRSPDAVCRPRRGRLRAGRLQRRRRSPQAGAPLVAQPPALPGAAGPSVLQDGPRQGCRGRVQEGAAHRPRQSGSAALARSRRAQARPGG